MVRKVEFSVWGIKPKKAAGLCLAAFGVGVGAELTAGILSEARLHSVTVTVAEIPHRAADLMLHVESSTGGTIIANTASSPFMG